MLAGLFFYNRTYSNNPHIPADKQQEFRRGFEIFLRHLQTAPEAAVQALHLGLVIGGHIGAQDALPLAARLLKSADQSRAGKMSAEKRQKKPWHKHAKELAIIIRNEKPWLSQERVAHEIVSRWATRFKRPSTETLEKFISRLEGDGTIQPARKGKTTISS